MVDENKVFSGAIDLKDLITADSEVELESITATSFPYVYANEQTANCIEKLKDYSEYIIPVLDDSNRLLGVITAQNIIEASDDEMGEDYAKLGGLSAEEDLNEPVLQSVKRDCHGFLCCWDLAWWCQQWWERLRKLLHSSLLLWRFNR